MIKNNSFFLKALSFFKKKDFKNALFYFNQQIKLNPLHKDSYYFIGKIYFLQRIYSNALNYFEVCYKTSPKNEFYNLYLGKTLLALKEYKKALPYLFSYQKQKVEGNFYLALAYYNLNNFYESVKYFKLCPNIFSSKKLFSLSYSAALFNLGNLYYINNQLKEAEITFIQSIKINSLCYPSYFQLGQIYLSKGKLLESKKYFEFLYNKFKKNESIKLTLAYIYNAINDLKNLEIILKNISNRDIIPYADIIEFKKILGYTLYRQRKYKEAIPVFIQLFTIKHYDEYTLFYLAQSRYFTGETVRALNAFKLIFEITEKNIFFNNSYLLMLIQEQKFIEAKNKSSIFIKNKSYNDKTVLFFYYSTIFSNSNINFKKYFHELRIMFAKNPMFIEATAHYFYKKNEIMKSIQYFYKLHKILPDDEHTLSKLVELFEKGKLIKEAIHYTRKMYLLNPQNEKAAFYYSYYLMKEGNYDLAIRVLRGIKIDQANAFYLLSDIYLKKKENKKGFYYLKKSFELNPLYLPIQFKSLIYFYKNSNYFQSLRISQLIQYTNPDFKRSMIYEALIYIKKNRFDLAINKIEKYLLINKNSSNPYLKFLLANCYYSAGMTDQTKKLVLHLIKENNSQAPYLVLLALCYKRNYKTDEINKIEKILEEQFKNTPSYNDYKSKYIDVEKKHFYKRNDLGIPVPF